MAITALISLALAATPVPPSSPEATTAAFVDAFRAMDASRFDTYFAPDVTMFFPSGPFPTGRVEGRDAVLSAFHAFFERAKKQGRTTLTIAPRDQQVERYGQVAIVTFWLDNPDAVGRRSIILRKIGREWRIAHFHASTIDKEGVAGR